MATSGISLEVGLRNGKSPATPAAFDVARERSRDGGAVVGAPARMLDVAAVEGVEGAASRFVSFARQRRTAAREGLKMRTSLVSSILFGPCALGLVLGAGCSEHSAGTCADNATCAPDASMMTDGSTVADAATADQTADVSDAVGTTDVADATADAAGDSSNGDNARDAGEPDASVVEASDAPACDPKKTPDEDACVVSYEFGIFVAPNGSDGNPGTESAPVATLGVGIDKAAKAHKRVYACAATYAEKIVIGLANDGIAVYGGFDCSNSRWTYATDPHAIVAPSTPGYALEIDGPITGASFSDIAFRAQDGNPAKPGDSSIAVFIDDARQVQMTRVTVTAGSGSSGAPGASGGPNPDGGVSANPSNWYGTPPDFAELNGADAIDVGGATSTVCTCRDMSTSTGGQGGGAASMRFGSDGRDAGPGLPAYDDAGGVSGMNGRPCTGRAATGGGAPGLDGPAAQSAAPAVASGAITDAGWSPAIGTSGATGKPGQGGGGGGNGPSATGGGGGGACGGCGGAGGHPGVAGGSSVAILLRNSGLTLANCSLVTNDGGVGGRGGSGEPGQLGSYTGGTQFPNGCPGGTGGAGAGGNGGQGGAGGVSVGIAYVGAAPTINGTPASDASTLAGFTLGLPGSGGPGGAAGAAASSPSAQPGAPGADGPNGIQSAVWPVPQ